MEECGHFNKIHVMQQIRILLVITNNQVYCNPTI